MERVLYEKQGYIAYVTLNRPEKLNALTRQMYATIRDLMDTIDADPEVRVVILRGAGRAFSAGFDINEEAMDDPEERRHVLEQVANAMRWKIWNLSKPVICQVHGFCFGGACELMLPCDFVIAAEDAQLGEPEIQFGASPAFLMLPWLVGIRKAKELLLSGDKVSGKEAAAIGLITRAVPAEQLEETVHAVAGKLATIATPYMKLQKLGINRQFEAQGLKSGLDQWVDLAVLWSLSHSDETREFQRLVRDEGVKAALAWRDARFASPGASDVAQEG